MSRPPTGGLDLRLDLTEDFAERFAGAPLKNVAIGVAETSIRNHATATRSSIEAGPIYAHSTAVREAIDHVSPVHADCRPAPGPDIEVLPNFNTTRHFANGLDLLLQVHLRLPPFRGGTEDPTSGLRSSLELFEFVEVSEFVEFSDVRRQARCDANV